MMLFVGSIVHGRPSLDTLHRRQACSIRHPWRSNPTCRAAQGDHPRKALIFDCDGVILESESLHLQAYNQAFDNFDVQYRWSVEEYDDLQNRVGGGKPKMHYYFGKHGYPKSLLGPAPVTQEHKNNLVDALQTRKTEVFQSYISSGQAEMRPGIERLMDEAISQKEALNLSLSICSASTKSSCLFVLNELVGQDRLSDFDVILAGDDVKNKKPSPDIYLKALDLLNERSSNALTPDSCIVIEDSLIGLQAAISAGMKCVITYTDSTKSQDFSGAVMVTENLGSDPQTGTSLQALLAFLNQ